MYPKKSKHQYVRYKAERSKRVQMLSKMRFMINLNAFKGFGQCTYIEIMLHKHLLVKQLFVIDIEHGGEQVIPKDLLQSNLPFQYRFYDPILAIINDSVSTDMRNFYKLLNLTNLKRCQDNSELLRKLLEETKLD